MATTSAAPLSASQTSTQKVPWYIWCSVIAVSSAMIGGHWDISWHRSIGRDTFWTPAHIAIYMCGVLAGISCGYLILSTTFQKASSLRETSIRMWGFRGPLGAFIAAWGGIAMLTSAPFDDWWHAAYGLDVKIVSPPHVLLILGILAVEIGALILIAGHMNRASGAFRNRLNWLFLYIGGMIMVILLVLIMEYTGRSQMHGARFYRVVATFIPVVLAGTARASQRGWAATTVTAIYTALLLGLNWILPLFPAEPKLGPVYQNVKQFIPPEFPLLLIVPAAVLDVLWRRTRGWNSWLQSLVSGTAFLAVFFAVQYPFANFLMSPAARNWFFGTHYFQYNYPPTARYVRYVFNDPEAPPEYTRQMLLGLGLAIVTTRIGLAWGGWMQKIRR